MKKLYIDIDGVLLTSRQSQPAPGAAEFIDYATKHFDCYWLTSYCRGDTHPVLRLLSKHFDTKTMSLLQTIQATHWPNHKSDAINFDADFYWLDDNPSRASIQALKEHDALDRLILVDLSREGELNRVLDILKNSVNT